MDSDIAYFENRDALSIIKYKVGPLRSGRQYESFCRLNIRVPIKLIVKFV
jgi:hypothetical protein